MNFVIRHLDISQSEEGQGMYERENQVLKSIVEALPNLTSLDISGTNLAGKGKDKITKNIIREIGRQTSNIFV